MILLRKLISHMMWHAIQFFMNWSEMNVREEIFGTLVSDLTFSFDLSLIIFQYSIKNLKLYVPNITMLNRDNNLLRCYVTNFNRACTTENRTYRV